MSTENGGYIPINHAATVQAVQLLVTLRDQHETTKEGVAILDSAIRRLPYRITVWEKPLKEKYLALTKSIRDQTKGMNDDEAVHHFILCLLEIVDKDTTPGVEILEHILKRYPSPRRFK